jgi:hypothetical protein
MSLNERVLREQLGGGRDIQSRHIGGGYVCTHGPPRRKSGSPLLHMIGTGTLRESQCSMSERSQPPEKCFGGNAPFRVQRNRVALWTPTTRRTSAVVIRWSNSATRSELRREMIEDSRRRGEGSENLSDSCSGASVPGRLCVSIALDFAATRCPRRWIERSAAAYSAADLSPTLWSVVV